MIKYTRLLLIVCGMCLYGISGGFAAENSTALIQHSRVFDQTSVEFEGEVVGPVQMQPAGAWVNIHDGAYAVGVWMPRQSAAAITYHGDYAHQGDVLRVVGTFSRSCDAHGGDLDIHARSVTVVRPGHRVVHTVAPDKWYSAIMSLLAVLLTGAMFVAQRNHEK